MFFIKGQTDSLPVRLLLAESERLVLWIPVLLGIGMSLYFTLNSEPSIIKISSFLLLSLGGLPLSKKSQGAFFTFLVITFIALGFNAAALQARLSYSAKIPDIAGTVWIRGTIKSIENMTYGNRLILSDLDLWQPEKGKFKKNEIPKKIRVNIRTKMENISVGQRVSFRGILTPPHRLPVYPGGYNFSFFTYFNEIGATGYSLSDLKMMRENDDGDILDYKEKVRGVITKKILDSLNSSQQGHIAAALITGQGSGISKDNLENMRKSGLGHLLSISGLHMAIVMGFLYFSVRAALALFPYISLQHDTKKMAALIALLGGFSYLLITGLPVPAVRSYIMSFLFFVAIIADRPVTPIRSVTFAALAILIFDPSSLFNVSFQMSFAAVIALISFFETPPIPSAGFSLSKKLLIYFLGVTASSIVAGLATSPYAIYHFGRYANYGLPANLVAIPLTSFLIMPFGVIAILLMPFGLEAIPFQVMGYGIKLLIDYSSFISSLPKSDILFQNPGDYFITLITLGGLWLCLWKTRLRFLGIIPLIAGIIILFVPKDAPDVIVDGGGKLFALRIEDGQLAFSSNKSARYSRKQWLSENGQRKSITIEQAINSGSLDAECDDKLCVYRAGERTTVIVKDSGHSELLKTCHHADFIVFLRDITDDCLSVKEGHTLVKPEDLKSLGTHLLWQKTEKKATNVRSEIGKRLWVYESAGSE